MPSIEHVAIPAPDGIRLAATLYVPAGDGPWPALLEALPYRKDDVTLSYRPEYVRFADAGYVVCRVDVRGTGSSEGIATDEYPPSERTDLAAVIDWLATRPWSTGKVGMFGTSYSGFNSLQVAMERPPALAAIVSIFASDDRYHDDVHYYGGAMKALDTLDYPAYMVAMNALPPVPSRLRRGVARGMGASRRRQRALGVHVARAPAPRRLLARREPPRGLRRDRAPRRCSSAAGPTATRTSACAPSPSSRARDAS